MFQIEQTTQVLVTKVNPRSEFHGDEKVRAMDIAFKMEVENTWLNRIQPGLREHHYTNLAVEADARSGQGALLDISAIPLPDLRFPKLPTAFSYAKGEKWRGYRFIWDWGTEGEHVDFSDVVLSNLHYEIKQGGTVAIFGTIQYNGDELDDNDLHGELCGLASMGEVYFRLIAPADIMPAKKGYRAGQPDTKETPAGADTPPGPDVEQPDAGDIFSQHAQQEEEQA